MVQAEPLDYDHDKHPVAVIKPSAFGYAFGAPGPLDFLGPIQDTLSWFINSHIHNVRTALNNMFVVDPSIVELQDLKNPSPGKIIRVKRSAYGQDVKSVLQQLEVQESRQTIYDLCRSFSVWAIFLLPLTIIYKAFQEEGGEKLPQKSVLQVKQALHGLLPVLVTSGAGNDGSCGTDGTEHSAAHDDGILSEGSWPEGDGKSDLNWSSGCCWRLLVSCF